MLLILNSLRIDIYDAVFYWPTKNNDESETDSRNYLQLCYVGRPFSCLLFLTPPNLDVFLLLKITSFFLVTYC